MCACLEGFCHSETVKLRPAGSLGAWKRSSMALQAWGILSGELGILEYLELLQGYLRNFTRRIKQNEAGCESHVYYLLVLVQMGHFL